MEMRIKVKDKDFIAQKFDSRFKKHVKYVNDGRIIDLARSLWGQRPLRIGTLCGDSYYLEEGLYNGHSGSIVKGFELDETTFYRAKYGEFFSKGLKGTYLYQEDIIEFLKNSRDLFNVLNLDFCRGILMSSHELCQLVNDHLSDKGILSLTESRRGNAARLFKNTLPNTLQAVSDPVRYGAGAQMIVHILVKSTTPIQKLPPCNLMLAYKNGREMDRIYNYSLMNPFVDPYKLICHTKTEKVFVNHKSAPEKIGTYAERTEYLKNLLNKVGSCLTPLESRIINLRIKGLSAMDIKKQTGCNDVGTIVYCAKNKMVRHESFISSNKRIGGFGRARIARRELEAIANNPKHPLYLLKLLDYAKKFNVSRHTIYNIVEDINFPTRRERILNFIKNEKISNINKLSKKTHINYSTLWATLKKKGMRAKQIPACSSEVPATIPQLTLAQE